eukprot:798741-Rhodomonas_salina.4
MAALLTFRGAGGRRWGAAGRRCWSSRGCSSPTKTAPTPGESARFAARVVPGKARFVPGQRCFVFDFAPRLPKSRSNSFAAHFVPGQWALAFDFVRSQSHALHPLPKVRCWRGLLGLFSARGSEKGGDDGGPRVSASSGRTVLLFMEAVLRHGQSSIDNAAVYGGIAGMNGCDADMCMLTVLPFMKTPTGSRGRSLLWYRPPSILRARYAMSGSDIGLLCHVLAMRSPVLQYATVLRTGYANSGTDIGCCQ